jgi:hypothetical protein
MYKEIKIISNTGFEISIDAGDECERYTGFKSLSRLVTPDGDAGALMGICVMGGQLRPFWEYVPGGVAAWIKLDKVKERSCYYILGNAIHGLSNLSEMGFILEEEFEKKKKELNKSKKYLLSHGWSEVISIYGNKLIVNTDPLACQKLGHQPGEVIICSSLGRKITIVGVAPKTLGIFGEDTLWCRLGDNEKVVSWDDANFITKANILGDIFSNIYEEVIKL